MTETPVIFMNLCVYFYSMLYVYNMRTFTQVDRATNLPIPSY